MRILMFGRTGQVATEIARRAEVTALDRAAADLADPEACAAQIAGAQADVVINAAAYTAVDRAETEPDLAHRINAAAPAAMARAAAARGLPFVQISTDYVFDGSGTRAWRETDPVAPLSAYGRSKLAGEDGVRAAGGRHVILRTAWVFSAQGSNFVRTMLRLSETRAALDVVADQTGGPTPAGDIADTVLVLARALAAGHAGGTYHYGGAPHVSWADFARAVFAQAGRPVTVTGIPSSGYPTSAARPLNSRLDCAKLKAEFGINPADWRAGLAAVLQDLGVA